MTEVKLADEGGDTWITVDVGGGLLLPKIAQTAEEAKRIFDNVKDYEFREDDIMLCTFPKTGTNWCYEILKMLLHRSPERVKSIKGLTMIESFPADTVNSQPSPRVMNSHLPLKYLPSDMKRKRTKTILCVRNPKDTAVSYYNQAKGIKMYEYTGKFENFSGMFAKGRLEYCSYQDYLNEFQQAIEEDSLGFPLHLLYFEDLKTNGVEEVRKMAKFLEIDVDDQFIKDVVDNCGFDRMAADKQKAFDKFKHAFHDTFRFFRKGQIGDWKNWFTVSQSEMFDDIWKEKIRNDSMFHFRYSD